VGKCVGKTDDVAEIRNMIYKNYEANGRFFGGMSFRSCRYGYFKENGRKFIKDYKWLWPHPKTEGGSRIDDGHGPQALAKVCKQIRHEYRPIYIKNLSVEIDWKYLPGFLSTFFRTPEEIEHGPEKFLINLRSAKEDKDAIGEDFVDIYPLLKIQSSRNDFSVILDDMSVKSDHLSLYDPNRSLRSWHPKRREAQVCYELNDLFRNGLDSKWAGGMKGVNIHEVRAYRWTPDSKKKEFMSVNALDVNAVASESEFKLVKKGYSPSHKTGYYYVTAK
jgi:hypothetical protein